MGEEAERQYNALSEKGREEVLDFIDYLAKKEQKEREDAMFYSPSNMRALDRSIEQFRTGHFAQHELYREYGDE